MNRQAQDARWRRVFILALVVGILHILLYAWWTPPWQFPDEPRHYEYVRLIGDLGRPPGWNDSDPTLDAAIIRSMARFDFWRFGFAVGGYVQHRNQTFAEIWTEGNKNVHIHPPLYYGLMATLTNFLPRQAIETQLLLLRVLSVLIGAFSLLLIGLTGVALRGWREGVALMVFAALLPGHAAINAAVNNDVFTELFGILTVFAGVLIMRQGIRPIPLLFLVGGLLLAVLTKRSAVFLVVYASLALLTALVVRYRHRRGWIRLLTGLMVTVGVVLAGVLVAWQLGRVGTLADRFNRLGSYERLASLLKVFPWQRNGETFFQSFWARLGWLNVSLPTWAYTLLLLVTLLALLGWGGILWQSRYIPAKERAMWYGMALTFGITVVVQLGITFGKGLIYPGTVAQGRYVYPFLPAYALFYVHGWQWWARRLRLPPLLMTEIFLTAIAILALGVMLFTYYGS